MTTESILLGLVCPFCVLAVSIPSLLCPFCAVAVSILCVCRVHSAAAVSIPCACRVHSVSLSPPSHRYHDPMVLGTFSYALPLASPSSRRGFLFSSKTPSYIFECIQVLCCGWTLPQGLFFLEKTPSYICFFLCEKTCFYCSLICFFFLLFFYFYVSFFYFSFFGIHE